MKLIPIEDPIREPCSWSINDVHLSLQVWSNILQSFFGIQTYSKKPVHISPGEHLSSIAASETIQVSMQIIYCTITLLKITLAFPRSSTLSFRQEGGWRWRVIAAMCFSISPLYGLFSICWNTYKKQIKLKLIESDGYIYN